MSADSFSSSPTVKAPTERRMAPLARQLPKPEMLKDFLKVEMPSLHFRERRLEKAQDM